MRPLTEQEIRRFLGEASLMLSTHEEAKVEKALRALLRRLRRAKR